MAGDENQFWYWLTEGRHIVGGVAVYEYLDDDGTRHARIDYLGETTPTHRVGLLQTALKFESRKAANSLDVLDE
jgi:hypothetical protein